MALTHPALPVNLDWLLALPLEGEALVTLWAAVEADLAALAPQTPATRTARAALEDARRTQQLLNLRGRCLEGDWLAALPPFVTQLGGGEPPPCSDAATWGLELLLELHFRLLDPHAPPWELAGDERAELLWHAHALLERLEPLDGDTPERLPVVVEQISRYGAIAWMERPDAVARERAIRLLLRLAWVNPEAQPWALPALRTRIGAALEEQCRGEVPEAPPQPPWLEQAISELAAIEPAIRDWRIHAWSMAGQKPAAPGGAP